MTNDLMRDLIENRIPGHETPTAVWVTITPVVPEWSKPPEPDTYTDWFQKLQLDINRAYENLRMAALGALRTTHFTGEWIDYGARQGLTGLERAHFNEAVEKLARTNPWTREECAALLGKIMDDAEKFELEPLHPAPPADPRERALRAKQQRGTGPAVPDRERGRVTKYKEKF